MYFHAVRVNDHLNVISLILSHVWKENKEIYKINRHLTITIQQIQIMYVSWGYSNYQKCSRQNCGCVDCIRSFWGQ